MSAGFTCYCPIIGKKVEIKGEYFEKKKISFNPKRIKSICQTETGICKGNCSTCSLL